MTKTRRSHAADSNEFTPPSGKQATIAAFGQDNTKGANNTNSNNSTNILDATSHAHHGHSLAADSDDILEFMNKMQQDANANGPSAGISSNDNVDADDVDTIDGNGDVEEDDEEIDDDDVDVDVEEEVDDDIDMNVHNDAAVADNAAFMMQLQQFQQQQQHQQNQANNNIVKMKLTATAHGGAATSRSGSQHFELKYNHLQSNLNGNTNGHTTKPGSSINKNILPNRPYQQSFQLQVQEVAEKVNANLDHNQQKRVTSLTENQSHISRAQLPQLFDEQMEQGPKSHQQQQQQCLEYLGDSAETQPMHLCTQLTSPSHLLAQLRHLRLRNCCERNVYSSLHTLALNATLSGGEQCIRILEDLIELDALASRITCGLTEILFRFDCRQAYSIIHQCEDCKEAYRRWVCSTLVPYFAEPNDVIKPPKFYETATDSGHHPHAAQHPGHYQAAVKNDNNLQHGRSSMALSNSDNQNNAPTSYSISSSSSTTNSNHNNTNMASNMTTSHIMMTMASQHIGSNSSNGKNGTEISSASLSSTSSSSSSSSSILAKRAAISAATSNFITAAMGNSNHNSNNNNNYNDIRQHLQQQHNKGSKNNNSNHHVKRRNVQQLRQEQQQSQRQQHHHQNTKQFNDKLNNNYIPSINALHKRPQTNPSPSSLPRATSSLAAGAAATFTLPAVTRRNTPALTFDDIVFTKNTMTTTKPQALRSATNTRRRTRTFSEGVPNSATVAVDDGGGLGHVATSASSFNSFGHNNHYKSTNKRPKRSDDTSAPVYMGGYKEINPAHQGQNYEQEVQMLQQQHKLQFNDNKVVNQQQQQQQQSLNSISTAINEDSLFAKDPVISKLLKRSKRKVEFRKRRRIRPCLSVCQTVEQKCPYLLPADRAPSIPTQYAGEPTFLCLDYNIAETEEQLRKASHGPNECCYTYCPTTADGICTYCNDFLDTQDIEMEAERINKESTKRIYNITMKARNQDKTNDQSIRVETKIQKKLSASSSSNEEEEHHLKMSTVAIAVRNDTLALNVTRLTERLPYYAYCEGVYYYDDDIDDMPEVAYSEECTALPTVQSRCRIPYFAVNYETSGEIWGSYRKHNEAQKLWLWLSTLLCLWSCYTARVFRLKRLQDKREYHLGQQQQQRQPTQLRTQHDLQRILESHQQQQQPNNNNDNNINNTAFKSKRSPCKNCENREIMLSHNDFGKRAIVWYDITENRLLLIYLRTLRANHTTCNRRALRTNDNKQDNISLKWERAKRRNFHELVRRRQQIDLLYSKNALILLIHYTNRLKSFMQQTQPHRKRKLTHLNRLWWWWRWWTSSSSSSSSSSPSSSSSSSSSSLPLPASLRPASITRPDLKLKLKLRIKLKMFKMKTKTTRRKKKQMNCSNVSFSHCSCSLTSCSCNKTNNYNNNNNTNIKNTKIIMIKKSLSYRMHPTTTNTINRSVDDEANLYEKKSHKTYSTSSISDNGRIIAINIIHYHATIL
uniref:Uncharacterized protein n=1 Tax=Stomoxys calcitrans TaxID=35570 RepID=A0A1I8P9L4_STOCA